MPRQQSPIFIRRRSPTIYTIRCRKFPIKDELQALIHEFKKQGVNLNQIAYSLNQNPYANAPLPDLVDLQKQNRLLTEKLADLFEQVTIV